MATRGAKPKPAHLRLVDGTRNATRHGSEDQLRKKVDQALTAFGPLQKPKHLKGEALAAWRKYIEPAGWLDSSKEPAAIAFCELWSEFRESPTKFVAARHGQLRAYMSELGLTDERNRGENEPEDGDDTFDA
jgi:phage terminase small subunit